MLGHPVSRYLDGLDNEHLETEKEFRRMKQETKRKYKAIPLCAGSEEEFSTDASAIEEALNDGFEIDHHYSLGVAKIDQGDGLSDIPMHMFILSRDEIVVASDVVVSTE